MKEKIALFVDGWNFNRTVRDCFGDITIDYKKLLDWFSKDAYLVAAYYYTGDTGAEAQAQFLTWLKRNGFRLVTRVAKVYDDGGGSEPKFKANLDVEIAVDIMTLAPHVDRVILFSGDGDFTRLLKRVGTMGVRTHVVSHWKNGGSCLSPDLLEAADQFTDIAEFVDSVRLEEPKYDETI